MKQGSQRHAHAKSTLFFSSKWKWKAFSEQHLQLYTLIFYIFAVQSLHKRLLQLTQARNKVHVYSTEVPYSGTCPCKWLCVCKIWRLLVMFGRYRDFSVQRLLCTKSFVQRLLCTKSFVHGISVIKNRRSLTTEIVKNSFHCIFELSVSYNW